MLAAFGDSRFRLSVAGTLPSSLGFPMEMLALGWLVVELAARDGTPQLGPLYLGLMALGRAVPGLAFGLFAGVVIDRFERRRVALVWNSLAGAVSAVLAVLALTGAATLPMLVVLSSVGALVMVFDLPIRQTIAMKSVPNAHMVSAVGMYSVVWQLSSIVGPLIGGLLIVPFGSGGVFLVKAVGHIASHVLLARLPAQPADPRRSDIGAGAAMLEGLRFVWREPVLRWTMLALVVVATTERPVMQLLPAMVKDVFHVGAGELSILLGAAGIGTFSAALLTEPMSRVPRPGLLFMGFVLGSALGLIVLSLQASFVTAIVPLALTLLALQAVQGLNNTFIVKRVPNHMLGRALSINSFVHAGPLQVGTLILGSIAVGAGLERTLIGASVLTIVLGLAMLVAARGIRTLTPATAADVVRA